MFCFVLQFLFKFSPGQPTCDALKKRKSKTGKHINTYFKYSRLDEQKHLPDFSTGMFCLILAMQTIE